MNDRERDELIEALGRAAAAGMPMSLSPAGVREVLSLLKAHQPPKPAKAKPLPGDPYRDSRIHFKP